MLSRHLPFIDAGDQALGPRSCSDAPAMMGHHSTSEGGNLIVFNKFPLPSFCGSFTVLWVILKLPLSSKETSCVWEGRRDGTGRKGRDNGEVI